MRKKWNKAALAISACLFVLWWLLGTTATLAWFSEADSVRNEFRFGTLDLEVSYKNSIGAGYSPVYDTTPVFNDEALYEPGYTQVVFLKIENKGDANFNYKVAVTVKDSVDGRNAWGEPIYLRNYLRYGIVFAESEEELKTMVGQRLTAQAHADNDWGMLDTWGANSPITLNAGAEPHYAALIVRMPEDVGNEANYRGIDTPKVILGVTVHAQQEGAPW